MFGHQVVAHLVDKNDHPASNSVDGDDVPASHFGVVLTMSQWRELKKQLIREFGKVPKLKLINVIGGGSSALGFWNDFIDYDKNELFFANPTTKIITFSIQIYYNFEIISKYSFLV